MGNTYGILESFEHRGLFRLPCSDSSIAGILSYTPTDGGRLELIGSVRKELASLFNHEEVECIWGELDNGKDVSLFHCFPSISFSGGCSFPLERFSCNHIIIGINVLSYDEPLFDKAYAKFDLLPLWCRPSKLTSIYSQESISSTLQISPLCKEIKTVSIDDTRRLSLLETGSFNSSLETHGCHYEEDTVLALEYSSKQSALEVEKDINLFCNFLSFSSLSLQACSSISVKYGEKTVFIISKPLFMPKESEGQKKLFFDFLISYKDIEASFDFILKKWFNEKSMKPIVAHLIDSVTTRKVFTENDFLIVVQALDGYQKRFIRTNGSLEKRIKEMFDKYEGLKIFEQTVFNAKSIAKTRNYFSHLFDENELTDDVVRTGYELFEMTRVVRKLLICYIMEYVGFSIEDINSLTKKSANYYLK